MLQTPAEPLPPSKRVVVLGKRRQFSQPPRRTGPYRLQHLPDTVLVMVEDHTVEGVHPGPSTPMMMPTAEALAVQGSPIELVWQNAHLHEVLRVGNFIESGLIVEGASIMPAAPFNNL
jgi:hypothetical protein